VEAKCEGVRGGGGVGGVIDRGERLSGRQVLAGEVGGKRRR
jgi:hypothetical protein